MAAASAMASSAPWPRPSPTSTQGPWRNRGTLVLAVEFYWKILGTKVSNSFSGWLILKGTPPPQKKEQGTRKTHCASGPLAGLFTSSGESAACDEVGLQVVLLHLPEQRNRVFPQTGFGTGAHCRVQGDAIRRNRSGPHKLQAVYGLVPQTSLGTGKSMNPLAP